MDLRTLTAVVINVHDGDTITLDVTYPVRPRLRSIETIDLRLSGIQAPETTSLDPAVKARAFISRDYLASLIMGRTVLVQLAGADKYGGREDGTVFLNDVNINQNMIDSGHAVAWNGHGPKPIGADKN